MNWDDASEFCASVGGRLCTRMEVDDHCVHDSGCEYDYELIWTSTSGMYKCVQTNVFVVLPFLSTLITPPPLELKKKVFRRVSAVRVRVSHFRADCENRFSP